MTHPLYHMTNVPYLLYFTYTHFTAWLPLYCANFTIQNQLNTQTSTFPHDTPTLLYNISWTHTSILMQDTPTLDISPFYCKKSTLLHDAPTQLYRTPTSPHAHIQFNTQISSLLHDTSTLPYDRYSLHPLYCTHIHFTTQLFPSALFQQNNWLLLFCFWLDCNSVTDWLSDTSSRGLSVNPCP